MSRKFLITGGSGLVGTYLSQLLLDNGHQVVHLGRSKNPKNNITTFIWDIKKQILPKEAFEGVDVVIHLAGATVSKRWTKDYKKVILDSRIKSIQLIRSTLDKLDHQVSAFISSSGTNIYPDEQGDRLFFEDDEPDTKFLAKVCQQWEEEAHKLSALSIRTVCLRTGMVLSEKGGALDKLILPVKFGIGAPIGSGNQYVSWVHIHDLAEAYQYFSLETKASGNFNVVSSHPVTNKALTKAIGQTLHRPIFLPNIPSFLIKAIFGEMSTIILNGINVSNQKLKAVGFQFKFDHIQDALNNLLK